MQVPDPIKLHPRDWEALTPKGRAYVMALATAAPAPRLNSGVDMPKLKRLAEGCAALPPSASPALDPKLVERLEQATEELDALPDDALCALGSEGLQALDELAACTAAAQASPRDPKKLERMAQASEKVVAMATSKAPAEPPAKATLKEMVAAASDEDLLAMPYLGKAWLPKVRAWANEK